MGTKFNRFTNLSNEKLCTLLYAIMRDASPEDVEVLKFLGAEMRANTVRWNEVYKYDGPGMLILEIWEREIEKEEFFFWNGLTS